MEPTASPSMKAQPEPVALFVSDVHLHASLPRTTDAFLRFLRLESTRAAALYILGDLFEYWAGDDDASDPFHAGIADALRAVAAAGVAINWIAGNRDFLVGREFARACGITLLEEPHVVLIARQRVVLLHGDAQCTDDAGYMAFREQVRHPAWQAQFLALPLAQRKAMIDNMRAGSKAAQREKSYEIMDVNREAVDAVFRSSGASIMIHGHTHRPGTHTHVVDGVPRQRHVLPDWDCDAATPRGGWLAMHADGALRRFNWDGRAAD